MRSKFQRRHYEAIAEVLAEIRRGIPLDLFLQTQYQATVDRFIHTFEQDNPRFREDQFRQATEGRPPVTLTRRRR